MERYMQRAIELAERGAGWVRPNPMVGCVIVHQDRIVGEGWHREYGQAHAEVNALNTVADPSILPESTLYVTLEPCSHFGKTPPCADRIIASGIRKVVIATIDPNPLVSGEGVKKLRESGITVIEGVEQERANAMNRRFMTFHTQNRPYVILKWAQTRDGFMDIVREDGQQGSYRISGDRSRRMVHRMRASEHAILVGKTTVLNDDPSLTTRHWSGAHPIRIVWDQKLEIPQSAAIFHAPGTTWVFNGKRDSKEGNTEFITWKYHTGNIDSFMQTLYRRNIQSVLVEGGRATLHQFLDAGIWDELWVFESEQVLGKGLKAPEIPSSYPVQRFFNGEDWEISVMRP